jgi:hypothetical protein
MGQKAETATIIISLLIFIPIAFIALFSLISFIISRGGWNRLAGRYPAPPGAPSGKSFYRVTGRVGTSTYKGSMKAVVTASGLYLDVSPVFRIGHKPLLIGFSAMRNIRKAAMFRSDYLTFEVGDSAVTISLPAEVLTGTGVVVP